MPLQEALLQSVAPRPGESEVISVFPAWPQERDTEFRLLVRGAFLVSTALRCGEIHAIEIQSRPGEECRVRSPWPRPCRGRQAESIAWYKKTSLPDSMVITAPESAHENGEDRTANGQRREVGETMTTDVTFRSTVHPGVRFTSGRTICDESLMDGRLVGRYWAADGRIKPERDMAGTLHAVSRLPVDAFHLEINGQTLSGHWRWETCREEVPTENGIRHAVVELANSLLPVRVTVHTRLDGTPVLTRWLEIANLSDRPVAVTDISPWAGLLWVTGDDTGYRELLPAGVENVFTLGHYHSSTYGWEGSFDWQPLRNQVTRLDGNRGMSGYGCPFFIVRNEALGEYMIGDLAWSGNWQIEFTCDQDPHGQDPVAMPFGYAGPPKAYLLFKAGPMAPPPHRILDAGETIATPAVHLGHVQGDLDDCVQAMHAHLRRSVMPAPPTRRSLLVEYSKGGRRFRLSCRCIR